MIDIETERLILRLVPLAGLAASPVAVSARVGIMLDDGIPAEVEAVVIGGTMAIMGAGLVIPVMILTFAAAFVPIVGATVAGVIAVLVTLAAGGVVPALVVAVVATFGTYSGGAPGQAYKPPSFEGGRIDPGGVKPIEPATTTAPAKDGASGG